MGKVNSNQCTRNNMYRSKKKRYNPHLSYLLFPSSPKMPHIIIATPTAPPTTANISRPNPTVFGAKPVCSPGLLPAVPLAEPTPAVPLGTDSSCELAGTIVTAVTVLLLPSGNVVVRREVVVCDCRADVDVVLAELEPEVLPLGARVREPPPTVVTMVTPWALTLVIIWPELNVPVVRAPWALVKVATWPAVRALVSGSEVAAPVPELDATGFDVLASDTEGEVLVERTVVGPVSDEAGATDVSVERLPSGKVLVAVATEPTGVTWVVADAELGTSVLLLSTGTTGAADVVVVLLSCRLASATILLAIDASSLCRASAAVLSFSNMPWVNFLGEKSCRAACSEGGSTWSSKR